MRISLRPCVLFVALAGGCTGSGQLAYAGQHTTSDLVVMRPGVQVITGLDDPIFYNGGHYWRNEGGFWYRSTSHTHGWIRVEDAPVEIRTIERPSVYIHYHGEARADVFRARCARSA